MNFENSVHDYFKMNKNIFVSTLKHEKTAYTFHMYRQLEMKNKNPHKLKTLGGSVNRLWLKRYHIIAINIFL